MSDKESVKDLDLEVEKRSGADPKVNPNPDKPVAAKRKSRFIGEPK